MESHDKGPLLGQQVRGSESYDPALLFPVPRSNARSSLPMGRFEAFGEDVWHAYELSWLTSSGMPCVYLGVLRVPATSPNIVESKSVKLYLNSLNNHRFADVEEARNTIEQDLGAAADAPVCLELYDINSQVFDGSTLDAECLDALEVVVPDNPDPVLLQRAGVSTAARVCTHLMRSRCPVTDQPDWATVVIETRGAAADRAGLLSYLLAYRDHQEFHEQCVERIYTDLHAQLSPDYLSVQALYTRRGGLDICPWRCSEKRAAPLLRLNRQ